MRERVVVTGANGFVGASLQRSLAAGGVAVTGLARRAYAGVPVRATSYEPDELARLVDELEPETLIHTAGSASVARSIAEPHHDFAAQVLLFQRVLEGVRRARHRPRVVFLSSAAVYGNPERLPVAEDAPLSPISPYGHHKRMAEQLAQEYAECFGVPTLVVRLFSLFGPAQRRLLLWELFEQFRDRPEVVVEGTGDEARDYLHVDDLAETMRRLVPAVATPSLTVNVASGRALAVRELAARIGRVLHSDKRVVFRGRVLAGNPTRWQADVALLERLVGALPAGDFDERLAKTIDAWRG